MQLIKNWKAREWPSVLHGSMSQLLTGHGKFQVYTRRIKWTAPAMCALPSIAIAKLEYRVTRNIVCSTAVPSIFRRFLTEVWAETEVW